MWPRTKEAAGPLCVADTEGGCDMWLVVSADRLLNGIITAPEELEIVLRQHVLSIFNLETDNKNSSVQINKP